LKHASRIALWTATLAFVCLLSPTPPARPLPANGAATAAMDQNPVRRFAFAAERGQFVRLGLAQNGVDLTLAVYGPDAAPLVRRDSPCAGLCEESLFFIAPASGSYLALVRPKETAANAPFELSLSGPRPPTEMDLLTVNAFGVHAAADRGATDAEDARALYLLAAELWTACDKPAQAALAHWRLAQIHRQRFECEPWIASYRTAAERYEALDERDLAAMLHHNLAAAYYDCRRPQPAIDHYRCALQRRVEPDLNRAWSLFGLGLAYGFSGDYGAARAHLEEARGLFAAYADASGLARTHRDMGWLAHLRKQPAIALEHYDRALDFAEDGDLSLGISLLDRRATALAELGRRREAMASYGLALKRLKNADQPVWTAMIEANIGAMLAEESPQRALPYFDKALPVFEKADMTAERAHAHFSRALARQKQNRPEEALADIDLALALSETLGEQAAGALRARYSASRRLYQDLRLDLLLALHERSSNEGYAERAFEWTDRNRARRLSAAVAAPAVDSKDPSMVRLEARVTDLAWARSRAEDDAARAELGAELDRLIPQYEAGLGAAPPPDASPESASPARLRRELLEPDMALLFYALGRERAWLWAVDRESATVFDLGSRAAIEADVHGYFAAVSQRDTARFADQTADLGKRLGKALLTPAHDFIADKRLLISPDGALHFLPFAALPGPGENGSALVEDHELAVIHSIALLASLRRRADRTPVRDEVVILANPSFHPDDRRPAMPHAEAEARAIADLAPGTARLRLGVEAAKSQLLSGALSNARLIHFATHGVLHAERGELSALLLATVDSQGRRVNGYLRSYEIRGLPLSAELATLSACDTALGEAIRGEGMVGLPQSFLQAGVRAVAVSLWQVDDEAGKALMTHFYRGLLQEDKSPAAAMAAAQRRIKADARWSAPFFWAGFTLQGDAHTPSPRERWPK